MDKTQRTFSRRPTLDEYFMEIAKVVATRSTCLRQKVGAVVVKDKRILATGYNGAPSGLPHCDEVGCMRDELRVPSGERQELCRGVHAEQNAIIQAAKFGISVEGATLYSTHCPCITCAKIIINSGIKRVVYGRDYADKKGIELLKEAGIETVYYQLED
ncbi:MAG: dCMP deaminase family protein [Archaeoglobaceae archaeon]|nr:dCMP deaminase family protein [Archaeoglobaceae archaeon]MCX8152626.1 dCMP deaminase family protein [Archaeoglobaceae archaeon]MDW8014092.1 dCMP deaminase family protein [Archaeoglobaceae archaeon]